MYKYYRELEKPHNYELYLKNYKEYFNGKYIKASLDDGFYGKYQKLFMELNFIDELVASFNFEWFCGEDASYEEWYNMGNFMSFLSDNNKYIDGEKGNKLLHVDKVEEILYYYDTCCNFLVDLFPMFKERIANIQTMIASARKEIYVKRHIEIKEDDYIKINFAPAFYITPKGHMYNSGGINGHKSGNFLYSYWNILKALKNSRKVISFSVSNRDEINAVKLRGFVTSAQFSRYANLIYQIITIETPETIEAKQRINDFQKKFEGLEFSQWSEEYDKYNGDLGLLECERTYQPNIVKLYLGFLEAEEEFYKGMMIFNDSNRKSYIYEKLKKYSFVDIMVQLLGFHKIESILPKTITTSTLNAELFDEYIKNGWTIYVIPKIVYDKYQDDLINQNLNSYFLNNKIDEIEDKYKDKVKVMR